MARHATAVWQGTGKEGKGNLTTQSGILNNAQYSWSSRFAEGSGTNPEELIAAAHAGCFTMKLSFVLGEAGFTADKLETKCEINLENGQITKSHLTLKATVPGISNDKFQECANNAKDHCPVSKLLNTNISLEATLG
jgi:lipoyl-dependent peroxiredoxin